MSYPYIEDDSVQILEQEIQAVITSIAADFIMRSKLTRWRAPTALVNGGWCACLTKQKYQGPKVLLLCACRLRLSTDLSAMAGTLQVLCREK